MGPKRPLSWRSTCAGQPTPSGAPGSKVEEFNLQTNPRSWSLCCVTSSWPPTARTSNAQASHLKTRASSCACREVEAGGALRALIKLAKAQSKVKVVRRESGGK